MKHLYFAAVLAAVAAAGPGRAAGCPAAVESAALAAHPGSRITECEREHENGTTTYEVELSLPSGRKIDCEVAPDGTSVLTEEPVAWSDVPPAVAQAFAAAHGAATPKSVTKQTASDGRVGYEIEFKEGGKKKEVVLDASGKTGHCPEPKPGCICPMIYAPVRCDGGCTYPSACAAGCASATGCVPAGSTE